MLLLILNEVLVVMMIVVQVEILYILLDYCHHIYEVYLIKDSIHFLLKLNDHFEED